MTLKPLKSEFGMINYCLVAEPEGNSKRWRGYSTLILEIANFKFRFSFSQRIKWIQIRQHTLLRSAKTNDI